MIDQMKLMPHLHKRKFQSLLKIASIFFGLFLFGALIAGVVFSFYFKDFFWSDLSRLQNAGSEQHTSLQEFTDTAKLLSYLGGVTYPRHYLVLFQNNTELRPTGGFIGSFAVIRVYNGNVEILWVEDSYNLDRFAKGKFYKQPPKPIEQYLAVDSWYFRDANWDPDFSVSAQTALDLYNEERVFFPKTVPDIEFDGVIALTPTVIERLLKIFGPIHVQDQVFTSENFTNDLEYRVEYEYVEYGEGQYERKNILSDLAREMLRQLKLYSFAQNTQLLRAVADSLADKQLLIYSTDSQMQQLLSYKNWAGEMFAVNDTTDYFMLVDANLGSLKTDASLKRALGYSLREDFQTGDLIAKLEVQYDHQGEYDWKTTEYQSSTRIFLPYGVKLLEAEFTNSEGANSLTASEFDLSHGHDRTVFGTFITLKPQSSATLTLTYQLPQGYREALQKGLYSLFVQKQAGTIAHDLRVDINAFGVVQSFDTHLAVDRFFSF